MQAVPQPHGPKVFNNAAAEIQQPGVLRSEMPFAAASARRSVPRLPERQASSAIINRPVFRSDSRTVSGASGSSRLSLMTRADASGRSAGERRIDADAAGDDRQNVPPLRRTVESSREWSSVYAPPPTGIPERATTGIFTHGKWIQHGVSFAEARRLLYGHIRHGAEIRDIKRALMRDGTCPIPPRASTASTTCPEPDAPMLRARWRKVE